MSIPARIVVCPHCNAPNRVPDQRLSEGGSCGRCKGAWFTGQPIELTTASFAAQVERSELPVVVDFWAPGVVPVAPWHPLLPRRPRNLSRSCGWPS